ncbi:ABC transporter G family member 29 [Selaginella moellendorffii]|uniref:ABC transporter G family member 29 n=1 Tax=Selaginella moellendorffii TaxID=88036 RepID=UPI000D1C6CB7|nr:ABC transporter G family member 29 [Selaginella moellendorffii]|eukprot:XP_024532572.1 ABC transporter G family member 29 [Selaginella moellendorffii]
MAQQTVDLEAADVWASGLTRSLSRRPSIRNFSSRRSSSRAQTLSAENDEEALTWAALEKLGTYDRLRTSVLKSLNTEGQDVLQQVDVRKLGPAERQALLDKLVQMTGEDNEIFLKRLRHRINKVGIDVPAVEVRYENLTVEAKCYVGNRALPTLYNTAVNMLEAAIDFLKISRTKESNLTILQDVSGIIKPGRMTLLLGPPSSGKTTLLLALAGRLDPALKTSGKITYNGHELQEFVPQKTSAYISQHDLHNGEMTVRETLEFSARFQGVGTRYELLSELIRREKERNIVPEPDIDLYMKASAVEKVQSSILTDYTLRILSLDVCADTIVGDQLRRGISGGQKKRVTTGEMIVGPTKTLFMDEISTGLDSSTTFQIVKCMQQFVHVLEGTLFMSLLQPAPETYNLFDDVLLLSEGQVVYHGPREYVIEFFEECGFKCPERKDTADFLQEVTSRKDQAQYWADKQVPYRYITVKEFSERFKTFHVGQKLAEELSCSFDRSKCHPAALVHEKYSISKTEMFKISFQREWLLMKRHSFVHIVKTIQIVFVACITSTVFLRTEVKGDTIDNATVYLGALFYGLLAVMFNGMSELPMTILRLPVFFKQRDLLFYPAWAVSLPQFVLRLPLSLVEVSVWTCITYYVIGYSPAAGKFFRHVLLMLLVNQMSSSLFRLIAGVCRTMVVANTGGSLLILLFVVLSGFLIPRDHIPNWWIWGYWMNPLPYAENAISVNEMLSPRWDKPFNGTSTIGATVLKDRGFFARGYWYWIGVGAMVGFMCLFNVLFTLALTYLNPLGKHQVARSHETLAEIEASQEIQDSGVAKPLAGSRSSSRSLSSFDGNRVALDITYPQNLPNGNDVDLKDARGLMPKRGMRLPFKALSISFSEISYSVDMPVEMKEQGITDDKLRLLKDITGSFRPGVLTTLMGVSGAGKTTLMDVLAGRKTGGYIDGDIKISGFPKKQETFARISGYCEQNDIHSPQVTVHESLLFSAWLRLAPNISSEDKMSFVEEVMELVELDNLRNSIVGLPGVSGLSTEQRKRLTIAVELVANPSIIFMDEPTSGLDARAAAIVMRTVRNTVDTGRTVACTIHQPSIDIFEAFDELLLLKRGGQVIYAGPLGKDSQKLIEYFEAIPGVPKIPHRYNPATWMLEVTSLPSEQRLGVDFADIYIKSELYQRNKSLVKELSSPKPEAADLYFPTKYTQSLFGQLKSCLWKQYWTYWRSPDYNCVRLIFTLIAALLYGSIFWKRGEKTGAQGDLFTVMGAMYGAVIVLGVQNCSTVQPVVSTERTVFYRERAAGMYSALPYAMAQVLIEIPYLAVQSLIYCPIIYSMMSFEWSPAKFFWYLFFTFFTFMYFTYYGLMSVSMTPNHQVAAILSSAFYSLFNLFAGFLIPYPKIPKWWTWYYWICPVAWTVNGLFTSQYGDVTKDLLLPGGEVKPVNVFLEEYFGFHYDFLGVIAGVVMGFSIFFAAMFAFCIKVLNFQTR